MFVLLMMQSKSTFLNIHPLILHYVCANLSDKVVSAHDCTRNYACDHTCDHTFSCVVPMLAIIIMISLAITIMIALMIMLLTFILELANIRMIAFVSRL